MQNAKEMFIPEKIVIGRFGYKGKKNPFTKDGYLTPPISNAAIVTCKFKSGSWLIVNSFKRLTGFKPTNQTDTAAQLKKQVTGAVEELDNSPASGFSLFRFDENLYSLNPDPSDVVISDPRGFVFPVSAKSFFKILESAGGCMKDNVFEGEYVYVWPVDTKEMTLVRADTASGGIKYSEIAKKDRLPVKTITEPSLTVGKTYRAARVLAGDYMYLGKVDTYSRKCHIEALASGKYDVDRFVEEEKSLLRNSSYSVFPTTVGKLVFYRVNPGRGENPYVIRTSGNGVFAGEVDVPGGALMHNSMTKRVTYENVLDDMRRNIAFSKLELSHAAGFKPVSFELFEEIFDECLAGGRYSCGERRPKLAQQTRRISYFPCSGCWPRIFKVAGAWHKFATSNYSYWTNNLRITRPYETGWRLTDLDKYSNSALRRHQSSLWMPMFSSGRSFVDSCSITTAATHEEIWKKYKPETQAFRFEGGSEVPEEQCVFLVPEDIVEKGNAI